MPGRLRENHLVYACLHLRVVQHGSLGAVFDSWRHRVSRYAEADRVHRVAAGRSSDRMQIPFQIFIIQVIVFILFTI